MYLYGTNVKFFLGFAVEGHENKEERRLKMA